MPGADRGSYRSVYDAVWDDPNFVALGRDGQHMWFVLKHLLGPQGIDRLYLGQIEERFMSDDRDEIERHLDALSEHFIEYAWLSRSRLLIWMRNGLKFEPSYTVKNPKHAKPTLVHVRGLPRHPIVARFMSKYGHEVHADVRKAWESTRAEFGSVENRASVDPATASDRVSDRVSPKGMGDHRDVDVDRDVKGEGKNQDLNPRSSTLSKEPNRERGSDGGEERDENPEDQNPRLDWREVLEQDRNGSERVPVTEEAKDALVGLLLGKIEERDHPRSTSIPKDSGGQSKLVTEFFVRYWPPTKPGAGFPPHVQKWMGRLGLERLSAAIRELTRTVYTVNDQERRWEDLDEAIQRRMIISYLNQMERVS